MCRYCNYESDDNRIFIDPLTNEYYLDIETMVCDSYDDGFFMIKNISIIVHGAEENWRKNEISLWKRKLLTIEKDIDDVNTVNIMCL